MNEKIKTILKNAVDELNEQLENKIVYSDDLKLMGKNAALDSMDFVAFISIVEEMISDEFDKTIRIVSDKAFSREHSPFKSMATLTSFISELLEAD